MKFSNRYLGKRPATKDSRTFKIERYLPLPEPVSFDWTKESGCPTSWPMFLNDQLGCCVVASALHKIQEWTGLVGDPLTPNDQDCLNIYEIFGFDPSNPTATDNGIDMLAFLKYWRKTGLPIQGKTHKILAFASVDPSNEDQVAQAIHLLGNVDIGVQLPLTAQNQVIWDVPGGLSGAAAPGSWGGHCIPGVADVLRAKFPLGIKIITWGDEELMTWYFLKCYCDELYAIISPEWIDAQTKLAPSGVNLAQLKADLALL